MVEECVERDSPAEYIACHEVEREGPRALGGLRVGSLYAAYQAGIVGIGEVEIEREVIAHITLPTADFDDFIEVDNLESGADSELAACSLHHLPG